METDGSKASLLSFNFHCFILYGGGGGDSYSSLQSLDMSKTDQVILSTEETVFSEWDIFKESTLDLKQKQRVSQYISTSANQQSRDLKRVALKGKKDWQVMVHMNITNRCY